MIINIYNFIIHKGFDKYILREKERKSSLFFSDELANTLVWLRNK